MPIALLGGIQVLYKGGKVIHSESGGGKHHIFIMEKFSGGNSLKDLRRMTFQGQNHFKVKVV